MEGPRFQVSDFSITVAVSYPCNIGRNSSYHANIGRNFSYHEPHYYINIEGTVKI